MVSVVWPGRAGRPSTGQVVAARGTNVEVVGNTAATGLGVDVTVCLISQEADERAVDRTG